MTIEEARLQIAALPNPDEAVPIARIIVAVEKTLHRDILLGEVTSRISPVNRIRAEEGLRALMRSQR